jgi:hypothetical protein
MFKEYFGKDFILNWHHEYVISHLMDVYNGKTVNLAVNMPPVSSTTTILDMFTLWTVVNNPHNRTIRLSYHERLSENSCCFIKDLMNTEIFLKLFNGITANNDEICKNTLHLYNNGVETGTLLFRSFGGVLMGQRAGYMIPGYSGSIIMDYPLKPEDSWSKMARECANIRIKVDISCRKSSPNTPMILFSPILHNNDCTAAFLESNKDNVTHVKIPAIVDKDYIENLPDVFKSKVMNQIPMFECSSDFREMSFWQYGHLFKTLLRKKEESLYTFETQYTQVPLKLDNDI